MAKGNDYYRNRSDADFVRDYEQHTKGYQIHAEKPDSEGHFSWSSCDTCGSTLGGDRYDCVLTNAGRDKAGRRKKAVDVESCVDCIAFAANGTLPSGG